MTVSRLPVANQDAKPMAVPDSDRIIVFGNLQSVKRRKSFLRGEGVAQHDSQYELITKSFQEYSPVHTPPPGRIAAR